MVFTKSLLLLVALALACAFYVAEARDSSLFSRHAAGRRGTHERSAIRVAAEQRSNNSAAKSAKGKKRKVLRRADGSCKPRSTTAAGSTLVGASTVSATSLATSVVKTTSTSTPAFTTTLVTQNAPALSGATSHLASTESSSSTEAPASSTLALSTSSTINQPSSTSATSTSTTSAPSASASAVSVDPQGDGPFSGQFTWYALGTDGSSYGACGTSLVDSDKVAAVSMLLFDTWPGYNGANPNNNPICGHSAKVSYGGKSVTVRIEDRCVGCAKRDIDLSESAFLELGDLGIGRADMTWEWVS